MYFRDERAHVFCYSLGPDVENLASDLAVLFDLIIEILKLDINLYKFNLNTLT